MQIIYTFMNEYLVKNHIFMNVMGALAGLGIPIKEALRGFCNKIVTRLRHVSFPQKVDRQTANGVSSTQCSERSEQLEEQ